MECYGATGAQVLDSLYVSFPLYSSSIDKMAHVLALLGIGFVFKLSFCGMFILNTQASQLPQAA